MEGIAIIGMAGRFPQAASVADFWRNLCEGVESIRFFSEAELIDAGLPSDMVTRPNYVRAKGFLEDAELFDAAFFGYHPREAEVIDPQQRLLLESAWSALEDAGYMTNSSSGSIGVFVGVSMNTYLANNLLSNPDVLATVGGYQAMISNDKDYAPTRISYLMNLKGPSIGIQTACSTSLVAVERACQSLVNHECDMALAGGASLAFPQRAGYLYQEGTILSPDGHCRVFDAEARGTVGGEGVGVVVLKRWSEAQRDGDNVQAIIRGWATNNDGSAKISYTAPGVDGQAAVIATAHALAGIDSQSITYVEAHGTGTELGDPIEISALSQVFLADDQHRGYCRIGSVKPNIGHLDAAAGIAGLIKTSLALKHRTIPPTLHFHRPNPHIDFANSAFRVNTELSVWDTDQLPRRAAVSSFGIGGTNAHLVLEEPPAPANSDKSRSKQVLVLSAKSDGALDSATAHLATFLENHPQANLADVAYTLQVGRVAFSHRRALVCQDAQEALLALKSGDASRLLTAFEPPASPQIAFLFPGQGAQYVQMGRELYENESCFREHLDVCAQRLRSILDLDIRGILYPDPTVAVDRESRLRDTAIAQPTLFAVEYALAKQWEEWGVRPAAMIGHSIGEYVAACLAGVFSLDDALWLVAQRGELMKTTVRGAMLAVPLSESEVTALLDADLTLAACNAPANSVVSGTPGAIARFEDFLTGQGITAQRLHTSHAFHSPMMDSISGLFRECVAYVSRQPPTIPFLSNLTGRWINDQQAVDPDYWTKHMLQTVRFSDGIATLLRQNGQILLEVGPGTTLAALARQIATPASQTVVLSSMRHPREQTSDLAVLLQTLTRLWLAGGDVDWAGFHRHERRRRVALPTYPFERKRYCVEPPKAGVAASAMTMATRRTPSDWFYVPSWKQISPTTTARTDTEDREKRDCWLLMMDNCGVGQELQQRLEAAGQQVLVVRLGDEFRQTSTTSFALNPQRFGDYAALFDELQRRSALPHRIVHLWNVSCDESASFDDWQELGFYSLLYLAQVLGRLPTVGAVQVDVISNRLQEVTGGEQVIPAKSTLRGPLLVIRQEYPHVVVRSIDIDLPSKSPVTPSLVSRLEEELKREVTDIELALRDRYCWTRIYEAVRVPTPDKPSPRLREQGVYWIIGGLGQISLEMARELARLVRAKIVLTGRSSLPPREQWDEWCDQRDPDEPEVRRIHKILEIEALGAQVMVVPADIADEEQMREAWEAIFARFGGLHGVIHSAGVVHGRIIHHLTPADCEAQFHAKVRGLYTLDRLVRGHPLDFCLINSSLSSVVGGMGFCAYTAANAFLDALAAKKNRVGHVPWFSINWDGWRFDQQKDWAQDSEGVELPLTANEGADAFARLLSTDWPDRVVVSTGELQQRIDRWVRRRPWDSQQEDPPEQQATVHPRPTNLSAEYTPPRNDLERTVAEIWQQMLGIEQIGVHDNYIELGGHSLLAGQLVFRSREVLKVPLSIRSLFEAPTVAQFAAHVETQRWAIQMSEPSAATSAEEEREEFEL